MASDPTKERYMRPALRLSYFLRIPNVGDRSAPAIVTAVSGYRTSFTSDQTSPHLLSCGSIMALATPLSLVWGTGVMHPRYGVGDPRRENIYAVRGLRSLSILAEAGKAPRDVVLGDPAVLAPRLLGISRSAGPVHDLGVVAHYVDRWHPRVRRLLATPGVVDLNVHLDPTEFLRLMANCRAVASSSLHGLVFAEALGVPSVWFTATGDVAGADFKFADWFSTTRRPQRRPRRLRLWDTARSLAQMAEMRESAIDTRALLDSFPRERCVELLDKRGPRVTVAVGRAAPLPVFLISYNRGQMLQQAIAGLQHLSQQTEIVIHDNGSTDGDTLDVLSDCERKGIHVFRRAAITCAEQLNDVDVTVREFFADREEPGRYVVSDCDIDMSIAAPDALELYDELLDRFRRVSCVGPMLRIRDIPRTYPLYNRVMNIHVPFAWGRRPSWVETSRGRVAYQPCLIDTTFALHRAGEAFRRLKDAVRVYEPYEARHLDWYGDCAEGVYHRTSQATIAHWNNREQCANHKDEPLRCSTIFVVRPRHDGRLRAVKETVLPGISGPSPKR